MMRLILIVFFSLMLGVAVLGGPSQNLYVAEIKPGDEGHNSQYLLVHRFDGGTLTAVDTVFLNPPINNRYGLQAGQVVESDLWGDVLVSSDVNIFRLSDGAFLYRATNAYYLGAEHGTVFWGKSEPVLDSVGEPDSLIQRVGFWQTWNGSNGFLARRTKWHLPGVLSPNQTRSAEVDFGGMLWIHFLDGSATILTTGMTSELSLLSSSMPRAPVLWLDNKRILTQQGNGNLVVVHVDGTIEPFLNVDIGPGRLLNPALERDPAGRIVYDDRYVIDPDRRSATPLERIQLGHGFEIKYSYMDPDSDSTRVWHDSVPIGTFFGGGGVATHDYLVVTECEPLGDDQRRPIGLAVWSYASREWTRLELPWMVGVIGWIEAP